jgi:DNA polymerase III epsilon subunit-like protein
VKVTDGGVTEKLSFRIKPRGADNVFTHRDGAGHLMSVEDVADAPHWDEIADQVLNFIGDYPVAMHKKEFNIDALMSLSERNGLEYPHLKKFSTAKLAQWIVPGLDAYYLNKSVEALAIDAEGLEYRNAGDDALMTALVAIKVAEKVGATNVVELTDRCQTALTTV